MPEKKSTRASRNSEKTAKPRGRPFPKGQSGNPRGRPKLPADVKAAYAAMYPRALERLNALVDCNDKPTALRAALAVIERVQGKTPQALAIATNGTTLRDLVRESMTINIIDPYAEPKAPEAQAEGTP